MKKYFNFENGEFISPNKKIYNLSSTYICQLFRFSSTTFYRTWQSQLDSCSIPPLAQGEDQKSYDEAVKNFQAQAYPLGRVTHAKTFYCAQDVLKLFNSKFSAYIRTVPLDLKKAFPQSYKDVDRALDDYVTAINEHKSRAELDLLRAKVLCATEKDRGSDVILKETVLFNRNYAITAKTSRIPFIKVRMDVDAQTVTLLKSQKDISPSPASAARLLAQEGAVAFRNTLDGRTGHTLYFLPKYTQKQKLLIVPAKDWLKESTLSDYAVKKPAVDYVALFAKEEAEENE